MRTIISDERNISSAGVLDDFDWRILDILQNDNSTPQREIAERVNLSAPAVQRRIKKLEQSGVIAANVAVIDPAAVGLAITILVEVKVESERLDLLDALTARFAESPEVQQCYYVTGDADFVLVLTVESMAHYEALTRKLFYADDNIRRIKTLVVMKRVKASLKVPLPG